MSTSRWRMIWPLAFCLNGGFLLIVRETDFYICISVSHTWAQEKNCEGDNFSSSPFSAVTAPVDSTW